MFWLILAGVVACYLGVGALRASMLNRTALLDAFCDGYKEATGGSPNPDVMEKYLHRVLRAYVLLWAYDDLLRLCRALRG